MTTRTIILIIHDLHHHTYKLRQSTVSDKVIPPYDYDYNQIHIGNYITLIHPFEDQKHKRLSIIGRIMVG